MRVYYFKILYISVQVSNLNDIADHRPRSTLILGSQLENQRIQNLEQENRELSISLAEHQSALELIMNKYREQVRNPNDREF